VPGEHIINPGNNIAYVVFDSTALIPSPIIHSTPAAAIVVLLDSSWPICLMHIFHQRCKAHVSGDTISLAATTSGEGKQFLTIDSGTSGKPGAMFNLIAHGDLTIDSLACKFIAPANTSPTVNVYDKPGRYQGYEQTPSAWNQVVTSYPTTVTTNQMTVLPDYLGIPMAAGDTLGMYITTLDIPNINIAYSAPHAPPVVGTVYKSDGVIDFVQGSVNGLDINGNPFTAYIAPRVWNGIVYYHTKAGLHYKWNTGDTLPTIASSPATDSVYWVKIYDNTGCNAKDSGSVKVNPKPTLSVGPDTLICDGLSYDIPGVAVASTILWAPSSGLNNPNIINPVFSGHDTISYVVTATDTPSGCNASTHLKIAVQNCSSYIHVPDAFSPNGNGTNSDHFTLFANRIASYELKIYNRWGELVYQTTDLSELNDMSKGWDGTYKGKEQNVGTFVYYLSATDDYNKQISRKGNITLLR
jgi:gliding motility-associated-like protein